MSTESPSWLDRMPSIGGALVLLLVIATVFVAGNNRGLQQQAAEGQAKLASAQAAGNVNATLIRMLATAAADHNDADIKALLTANGITYQQGAKPATAAAPADATTNSTEAAK
jgi:hypothetical protein